MAKYRICRVQPRHREPFWTVEKLTFGFWWRRQTRLVQGYTCALLVNWFETEKQAQNWIDLDKQGDLHSCGPIQ